MYRRLLHIVFLFSVVFTILEHVIINVLYVPYLANYSIDELKVLISINIFVKLGEPLGKDKRAACGSRAAGC